MESKNLNNNKTEAQKQAIEYGEGPLMVLAGPGSGKTTVITGRVRFLIEELHVDPSHILVVTFSRAAAKEMESRFDAFKISQSGRVTWGTFHSVYFSLLKTAYGYRGDQVATDSDRIGTVMKLLLKYKPESDDYTNLATDILSEIAKVKEEKIDIDNYYSVNLAAEIFRHIYLEYELALGQLRKIDFEDMLMMTYDLLKEREDILLACRDRYRWILVDEFQDINRMQYETIRMIAGERANLTIVGDDDQSIYRFRGARPEIMLGFKKDYPKAAIVELDINFRSTPAIVESSLKLINHNTDRFKKHIKAYKKGGRAVTGILYANRHKEVEGIISSIAEYKNSGYDYDDIAILYRTNMNPRLLSYELINHNIPFVINDRIPDIMEHWLAKDACAYLKLAYGIGQREDLIRIINRPMRYIKREACQTFTSDIDELKAYYKDTEYMCERLDKLKYQLKTMSKLNVYDAYGYIRSEIGYDVFLKEYAETHGLDIEELVDQADELRESMGGFLRPESWMEYMKDYSHELYNNHTAKNAQGGKGLRLMTFHASKGLEYPIVLILDANEHVTPHRKATLKEDIEEERRMFYVAMTRAKERLYICSCVERFHKKADPSIFVQEAGICYNVGMNK